MRASLLQRGVSRVVLLTALVAIGAGLLGVSGAGAASTGSLTIHTDASWNWSETNGTSGSAVVLPTSCYPGYNAWTDAIPSYWIWTNQCLQGNSEAATFTKTFTVPGVAVTSASARFAVDNYGTLAINGQTVITRTDPGFYSINSGSTNVTSYLHPGVNTLTVYGANTPSPGTVADGANPAGVSVILTVGYALDSTAPTDAPAPSPAPNANGWNNSDVTVNWNWSDSQSGVDSANCQQSTTSTGEGSGITVGSTCYDLAGNKGTDSVKVNVDKTKPTANPVYLSGWQTSDVSVAWNWTDSGSGIDPANCTQSSTSAGEGAVTVTATCSDLAGNSNSDSVTVEVDTTSPTDAPVVPSGWQNSDATVQWNWRDSGSGVDPANCTQSSTSSGEGSAITLTSSCSDNVGHQASDSATVQVDKTPPVVTYSGGGTYELNQTVSIACSATDALSGIASSSCPGVSSAAWQLGLGTQSLSASATDNAGNTANASTSYTVKADSAGICGLLSQWAKNGGIANSLCAKIQAAEAAGQRGQNKTKQNDIDAFDNEVRAQSGKGFTSDQATLLVQFAAAL